MTKDHANRILTAAKASVATGKSLTGVFYGSCGNEGCTDCRPLFDKHNQPIVGTEGWGSNDVQLQPKGLSLRAP